MSYSNGFKPRNPTTSRVRLRLAAAIVAVLSALLDAYHALIAPLLGAQCGWGCRFEPSCSLYAKSALTQHGILYGGYLTLRRLARCHPLGSHGYDPVLQTPREGNQP